MTQFIVSKLGIFRLRWVFDWDTAPQKGRLGDILSQRQNVPLHYAPPRRHNVPTYAPSPATFCPTFSIWIPTPRAKLARISGISGIYLGQFLAISLAYIWENHCSTCIFRATNCPIWQNVPLSPRRQNVPTYALMHRKVMESCWDILSVVPLCWFEGQYLGQSLRI